MSPAGGGATEPRPLPAPTGLHDGTVRLRTWTAADAAALAAAWADEAVRLHTAVPERRDVAAAEAWIAGEADRRAEGLALDLVISPAGEGAEVLGEVGLGPFDWGRRAAQIGYWVAPAARGRGIATRAVRLLAGWALDPGGLALAAVVATVRGGNAASERVLANAGFSLLAERDGLRHLARRTLRPSDW